MNSRIDLFRDAPTPRTDSDSSTTGSSRSPHETLTPTCQTAFGQPRDFLNNRFVYVVVSPRARGLTIGLNLNPDKFCNFDCVYCEVDRRVPANEIVLNIDVMSAELEQTLALVESGQIRRHPFYHSISPELLKLQDVVLSGDGEPTLSPAFWEVVRSVVHIRARTSDPGFKIVVLTNGTGLDSPQVVQGLKMLMSFDEIWVKLDAGTQKFMQRVNRTQVSLDTVLANIAKLGRQRPIVIQSLFPLLDGEEPAEEEINQYIHRLKELKRAGTMISLVQIYSASRPMARKECGHLPLKSLFRIARAVQNVAGIAAEVF